MGAGFYDRYLPAYKGIRIGVCYERCVADRLPCDVLDIPVQLLVTEAGVYDFCDKHKQTKAPEGAFVKE